MPQPQPSSELLLPARTSVLEESRVYQLGADALVVARQSNSSDAAPALPPSEAIPFSAITQIRLRYFPTRVQTNRYECIVTTRGHGEFKITNEIYKGIYQFEDHGANFRSFATELRDDVVRASSSISVMSMPPRRSPTRGLPSEREGKVAPGDRERAHLAVAR